MFTLASLLIIFQIIVLDGILSIDNAAALAAIAKELPENDKTPLSPFFKKILGERQQQSVLKVGILGAYVGRGIMLLLAGFIIYYGWLKLLAAAYLLYLCGVHFFKWKPLFDFNFKRLSTFWKTVIMIEIADLAFSLDNVAAVVAISSNLILVIIGVFISIIIMRFAAQIFMKLIDFEPSLENAAYVLISAIAIELILRTFGVQIPELLQFSISVAIMAGFIFVGQISKAIDKIVKEAITE